jgi:GT2 family glycosyltransferase/glycosyltransferase involved in cell wall biosynthesis
MTDSEKRRYRESVPFWLEDEEKQNFGDYLTAYLLDRLFLQIPRLPGDVRIIGSYLSDYHVGLSEKPPHAEGLTQRASLIAWAGGLREPGGLSDVSLARTEVLSVRGPLTASELRLGDDIAIGDPGLLMPALYKPGRTADFTRKAICVPHFNDRRRDGEIRDLTGADLVLRPSIRKSFNELEILIDRLTSADFVLCGSLHAAILASAYQVPFAFWDSGSIDIPFKWRDFAASVSIPCAFLPDVTAGRDFYQREIQAVLKPVSMWNALAVAPFPIRSEALLKILAHDMARQENAGLATVEATARLFSRYRHRQQSIVDDSARLVDDLSRRIETLAEELAEAHRAGEAAVRAQTDLARELAEAHRAGEAAVRAQTDLASEKMQALQAEMGRANEVLTRAGALMAEELRRTAARPWRPLKHAAQRAVLKFVLLFQGMMSDRTVTRLRRSLAKRKPRRFSYAWEATLAQAGGTEAPVDPLLAPVVPRPKAPLGASLAHNLLLGLAAVSAPFSERRAEKFRRSAAKRDPRRFRAGRAAEPIVAPFSVGQISSGPVADVERSRRILVADYRIPRPDLSAGEKATFGLIADLRAIGFEVTFLPTDMTDTSPYREALEALGVTVITRDSGHTFAGDYVRSEGGRFGAFYLIRVDVAEALLQDARLAAPDARMIFHAPDLYFLREIRGAELSGDLAAKEAANRTKARETAIMQASDHVVLVSAAEIPFLTDILPRSRISVFPALYSSVVADPAGYDARRHMFFLGGFKHKPNVDSIKWFVEKVWPAVHARLPDVEFHIVGAEAPADVIALGERPGVRFVGYVKDLDPILAGYRLSVAPLLYGAGIKGKLGAAMGAGVPCVSTTIGAEGMGIVDGVHAMVRDDAEDFAGAVVALYDDPALWEKISEKGRRLVEDRFGDAANQSAFYRALDDARALPLDLHVTWCQTAEPAPLPAPDPAEPVDVSIIVPVHNQWHLTRTCLISVLRAIRGTGITCEVILADDGSTDETLQAASLFPGLRVIRQDRNLGFPGNCNAAAAEARGEALLFLDNGTIVLPGWLTELFRVLREEPSAAIVGSKLLYPDGTIREAGGLLFSDASAANLGRGKPRNEPLFSFDRQVDYSTGASIFVRRSFWESVGGFDKGVTGALAPALDLSLSARHSKLHIICAARSEVIRHAAQTSAGLADISDIPTREVLRPLLSKWNTVAEDDYLPPATPPQIAAAHAERSPFSAAQRRRESGRLNVLYFSPFPSHPDNHGNQATIQSFGKRFQKLGHKVHFALLQSNMYDAKALEGMRNTWDTLDVLPNTRQLWANGNEIPFDGWYQPGLGENIRLLCYLYDIDVVFCSYVFQSKLLEFVPAHVLKVIDTHDKMGDRYEMLRKNGQPLEFFSCTPGQEGAYIRRADVVVARRAEEAAYFNSVSQRQTAIVIPHFEEPRVQQRQFGTLRNVGLVASANRINLAILLDFVRAVDRATMGGKVPFHVHIAGQVRDMIRDLPQADQAAFGKDWITLHGFVPNIADFYAQMDLIVSPVTMGTGINVKTVQAMAFGMPLLTTAWGCKGIETGDPMHGFATLDDLVAGLIEVQSRPATLEHLASVSRDRYTRFQNDSLAGFDKILQRAVGNVRSNQ